MEKTISFTVKGQSRTGVTEPERPLPEVLRQLPLRLPEKMPS